MQCFEQDTLQGNHFVAALRSERKMIIVTFLIKILILAFTLWFAIAASRAVCCSTFTYAEHKGTVAPLSQEYFALFKECIARY